MPGYAAFILALFLLLSPMSDVPGLEAATLRNRWGSHMDRWRYGLVAASLVTILALAAAAQTRDTGSAPSGDLRPTMKAIFQALTTVLPLSLAEETFQDATNRQPIRDALSALSSQAENLPQHGQPAPAGFGFLRRSLSRDAQRTLALFESGDFEASRFALHQLTDNCFLCHSRLPSTRPFPLGQRFLERMPMSELDTHARVRLAVASRQFDTALTTCETLFRSAEIPAAQIDLMALFEDYLRIAIRVQSDFPRAISTLERFQLRPDVPQYLTHHLTAWIEALNHLQADTGHQDALARARALIVQGQRRNRFLADRQGLVHFTLASGLLHRYVNSSSQPNRQLAEAYYLTGVAESYIPRTSWISETEFYLETAVRLAPASPFGQKAFAFLEEYLLMGYTGSSGLHLPTDIQQRLDDLRSLMSGRSAEK